MASKKLTYHRRIINLLADGQWHSFQAIHQAVARFVDADAADKEYRKRHPGWKDDKQSVRVAQGRKRLVWLPPQQRDSPRNNRHGAGSRRGEKVPPDVEGAEGPPPTTQAKGAASMSASPLFPLGRLMATPGALAALTTSGESPARFLDRHAKGDWGEVCPEDGRLNDEAVGDGGRILSAYRTAKGVRIWIITEADRSATTVLLPDEY